MRLDLDWIERLDVMPTTKALVPELEIQEKKAANAKDKAEDDFKREILFYKQAQNAVLEALPRLHQLNIKTKRPEDYFAEMAKSDDHMKKVRENLLSQEAIMERREKARKLRELKKYGKQVQTNVLQKQQKEKKEILTTLKKHNKLRNKRNVDDILSGKKADSSTPNKTKKGITKKQMREKKYGFGGQKKRSKYNTAESSADISFPSKRKGKPMKSGKKGGKKTSRPGKQRRQNIRNKKKR